MTERQLFFQHLAQTSDFPLALEIEKAKGIFLYDKSEKKYFDLISGISVSNLGHSHPKIISAIKKQIDKYSHLMAYGEFVQSPQVKLAQKLSSLLPKTLHSVYFTNSGAEATEGALKLAKKFTGRTEIISFKNAYHGSTHGALSAMGNESLKRNFRPLLPDVRFIEFNNENHLSRISEKTACVIVEPIQGEAGVRIPSRQLTVSNQQSKTNKVQIKNYLQSLREKCNKTKSLLIFDEAQTAFGRTGTMFAFEQFKVVPDILLLAKAFGGGMPLGAFISSKKIMNSLKNNPALGHITTFGGHPVCCASALASIEVLQKEKIITQVKQKEKLFLKLLKHPAIKEIRSIGLMFAIEFGSAEINHKIIRKCLENGVITDWFLFCNTAMRIAPPLIISEEEIETACKIILKSMNEV